MDSERWHNLEAVFQAALERPPDYRPAFLNEACAGDDSLKADAQRLVASFEEASNFIETPAFQSTTNPVANERDDEAATLRSGPAGSTPRWQAGLAVGQKIQQYELRSLLGAGGMGEVYLAYDGRLDRQVALKLLPAHFTQDQRQVRRFEREARAASSLNHPNIITIHEIGQVEDVHFMATEFIEGQTLRQQINGPEMPLGQVIDIALQIAGALSAAHSAGIVHRDIKPENVMVRPDGLVKVLDFGLAKALEQDAGASRFKTTSSFGWQTDAGTLMGTTNYLSPEQVRTEQIDHRTDIFSLGVLLYEMVSSRRPFTGGSPAAVFDSILGETPPAIVERVLPLELERIIHRALEKDRGARYQTAGELKADLKELQRVIEASGAGPSRLHGLAKAAVILGSLFTLGGSGYLWIRPAPDSRTGAQALEGTHGRHIKQTAGPGQELVPSLSPDAKMLVYASRAAGNWDIYVQPVREIDSGIFPEPLNLTAGPPTDDIQPAFSPDGDQIAFRSSREGGGIFVMRADGNDVRRVSEMGYNPVWSHDGQEIVFAQANGQGVNLRTPPPSALYAINLKTGKRRVITEQDAVQPSCSPNGNRIAYWGMREGGQRDIWTVGVNGENPVQVTNDSDNDWNPVWSHDGKALYFASDRDGKMNLWRIPIDEQSGEPLARPEPANLPGDYVKHFSLSKEGRLMAYVQESQKKTLYQVDFDPTTGRVVGRPTPINPGSRLFGHPDCSPDGEWLVFTNQGEKQEDLFIMRRDGKGLTRLTNDSYKDRGPRWSPDGKWIVFYSDRSGKYELWLINPGDGGLQQITYTSESMIFGPIWSPDSQRIVFRVSGLSSSCIVDISKPWGEQRVEQLPVPALADTNLRFAARDWSPDGHTLAVTMASRERPTPSIMLYSLEKRQFDELVQSGDGPLWLNDSRRLLYFDARSLWLIDTRTKKRHEILPFGPSEHSGYTISPDNRTIYFSIDSTESDIWLRSVE